MTKFKSATGIFNGAAIDVVGESSINVRSDKNHNTFPLNDHGRIRRHR